MVSLFQPFQNQKYKSKSVRNGFVLTQTANVSMFDQCYFQDQEHEILCLAFHLPSWIFHPFSSSRRSLVMRSWLFLTSFLISRSHCLKYLEEFWAEICPPLVNITVKILMALGMPAVSLNMRPFWNEFKYWHSSHIRTVKSDRCKSLSATMIMSEAFFPP